MADQKPIRVLLIDDDEAAFRLTRTILAQIPGAGFAVDHVATAREGEAAIARGEHDVYLVDFRLGEDSGIDLVRRARAARNRAPMILLTGKGRREVDVEAMEAGVSDYLEKGKVDPELMERSIRYALERVRAEAALRDSETRHRAMFDHLPVGLYRVTVEGGLVDVNPALVSMLGHPDRNSLESLYARNCFVSPSHRKSFLRQLEESGVVRGFESQLKRPDGQVVRIRNAARSHLSDEGEATYIEGVVEDVSKEMPAGDLRGLAARFAWLFGESGLAILVLDLQGAIVEPNVAFLRTFGYGREDLKGRLLTDLVESGQRRALAEELARVGSGRSDTSTGERRFVVADGTMRQTRMRAGLVRTPSSDPDHLMVVLDAVAKA